MYNEFKSFVRLRTFGSSATLWLIILFPSFLHAQYFIVPHFASTVDEAPEIVSRSAVLIDASTGALLYSKNGDDEIPPASLTKLMTMYIIMNEIKEGRASYDELIPITIESWAQSQPAQSSLMFLEPGQNVTLREIMLGLSVPSGNDAAVAAALRFAPSVDDFVDLMNLHVRRMGLQITRFYDTSGYSWLNITTANEFAYFCYQYVNQHPESLNDFHSVQEFSYPLIENVTERNRNNVNTITQESNNRLLSSFPGVDGLKTGFIPDAGYNIALTAMRENTRFILVILGAPSQPGGAWIRLEDGARLLTWAFENFKTENINLPKIENARLWKGKLNRAELKILDNFPIDVFTSPINRSERLFYETFLYDNLVAPLPVNAPVGYLAISDEYSELHRIPLVTARAYEKGNFIKRIWHSFLLLFKTS